MKTPQAAVSSTLSASTAASSSSPDLLLYLTAYSHPALLPPLG